MTVDIDQMPMSREMDKLIAQRVFGWVRLDESPNEQIRSHGWGASSMNATLQVVPFYSTNIRDAWDIIARLPAAFSLEHPLTVGDQWCARFEDRGDGAWYDEVREQAIGSTAPLAICRAALKFVDAREANTEVDCQHEFFKCQVPAGDSCVAIYHQVCRKCRWDKRKGIYMPLDIWRGWAVPQLEKLENSQ